MLDECHSTITPLLPTAITEHSPLFTASTGLLYYRLPAAAINLCFVYFSGRYEMTPFPLSSHLILRKLSLLWWIISSSVLCWLVETEQQAKCIVYSFLQDHRQWIKTLNIPFPVCWKDDYGPITVPLYPNGAHSYHRTHSFVLMFLTLTQSCKGGLIMDATAFLFKPRTILPLIGLFWYSSPNPCPLLWIWWI